MGYWDDIIQWVEEWRPVNYSVTEDEDFETVKQRAVRDFQYYLKLLDDGTEESRDKVYKSFTFSKLFGEELGTDEELNQLSKEIMDKLKKSKS
ncbi:TPA: hypothetical protein ACGO8N_001237 [Streptococcus suis]|uniref:hypothetical protein n=1 Tax=Streptococcus suis TaxID=1307 RepID=UPI002AADF1A3|nr:hypothetical protein [Streptococcus suis]HEM4424956.1 hypothetical protein [Streptococcus suis]